MPRLLRCEFAKLKRKPLFFAAAAVSALIPLGCALFLPEMREFASGAEAVDRLMSTLFQMSAYLLLMPALVVLASVTGRSGYERDGSSSTAKGSHWESFDAGAAAMAFCLAAHEKGLGTVIMGIFDEEKVRQVIHLPEDQRISALISIGYPDEEPKAPPRKAPEELMSFL